MPLVRQAIATDDATLKLRLAARWTRQQYERGADVIDIFEGVARTDHEMARTVSEWLAAKNGLMAQVIATMEPSLDSGLSAADATAIFLALTSFDIYRQFVRDTGWSPDRYQAWLESALRRELLMVASS